MHRRLLMRRVICRICVLPRLRQSSDTRSAGKQVDAEKFNQQIKRHLVKNAIATGLVLLALICAPQHEAMAVEPLSAIELASHCKYLHTAPEGVDGIFCIRYVQGFIDGAIATDERVTLNVAEEYHKDETFSERATRIRLGQRMESYGGSYYAEFCLGEPSPLAEVVAKVADSLERNPPTSDTLLARNVVYKTLREQYPCAKE
jgi:hypothetical protein